MIQKFDFLEHTADIKFRAFGASLNDVFDNCALAFSNYVSRGGKINDKVRRTIEAAGNDAEALLYNFLEALIALVDSDGFVVAKTKVSINGNKLTAVVHGDSTENYEGLDSVKAVTYAEMYVKQKKDKTWEAQVVLDV